MVYPKKLAKKKIEGKVFIRFIIDTDGSVTDVKVLKGAESQFDAEALRVVRAMSKWSPGILEGKPVKSYFDLPINFRL